MQVTKLSAQVKNPDRINVFVDGKFRFGLDIAQVVDLGIKVGLELDEVRLDDLEMESQFGRLYAQALNYCLVRPRSIREVRDYLWRKSQPKLLKSGRKTAGLPVGLSDRVLDRLINKKYLNDIKFTTWWIENRFVQNGVSARRLRQDLSQKGVAKHIIDEALASSARRDNDELQKVLAKKARRYSDSQKLMAYLVRQGFSYDAVKKAVKNNDEELSSKQ